MAEWNSTDDAVVRARLAEGKSYEQIGSELGRTPTAVQVRMFTLGLAQPQLADADEVEGEEGEEDAAPAPKRRGRPPKVAAAVASPAKANGSSAAAVAPKRRGRPPKVAATVAPVKAANGSSVPMLGSAGSAAPAPKRRDRPPKVAAAAAPVVAVAPPVKVANGNGHGVHHEEPAPAKLRRPRAEKPVSAAAPAIAAGFAIALGSHRLVAEGAAVELIEGGGLRLKFQGGSLELHGGPSA